MKTIEELKGEFIRDLTTVKAHCGGYSKSEVKLRLDEILEEQREEIRLKLLKKMDELEAKDEDGSMDNWRRWKHVRNNITDTIKNI